MAHEELAGGGVETVKNPRHARLAHATLSAAGQELVDDASHVIDDAMASMLERKPRLIDNHVELLALLGELADL